MDTERLHGIGGHHQDSIRSWLEDNGVSMDLSTPERALVDTFLGALTCLRHDDVRVQLDSNQLAQSLVDSADPKLSHLLRQVYQASTVAW